MKKWVAVFFGGCLCLPLTGCNGGELVTIGPGFESERVTGDDDDDNDDNDDTWREVSFRDDIHPTFDGARR